MKQSRLTIYALITIAIGALAYSFTSAHTTVNHIFGDAPLTTWGLIPIYGHFMIPKLTATLTLVLAVILAKNLLLGEQPDSKKVPSKREKKNARALVMGGAGLLTISTVSAVLPYYSVSLSFEFLGIIATVAMFLSIVPFYILQRQQSHMFWIKLRDYAALDERQLRERLLVIQKAYWISTLLVAIFLVLAIQVVPVMIESIQYSASSYSIVNRFEYFNWHPLVNVLIAILWMPTMVAAARAQGQKIKQ